MPADPAATPVVLLRSARHGGLGIVRSLGRLGAPVYVVAPDPMTPALHSRYCRGGFRRDIESDPPSDSLHFLHHLQRTLQRRAILIPTTDAGAMFVDEHAAELRAGFLFPERAAALTRALCSKKEMYALAKSCGVPTAETVFPASREDVIDYLRHARFPVMLKGIYGKKLKLRAGKPMFIVRDERELLARYDALEDAAQPNLMLQEYIPGQEDTVWMFNGYFDAAGECLFGATGQKLRQCPVYTGPACLGVCRYNARVDEIARRFVRAIGYRGPLDIDFRFDARDGQYKILDVNPRIGASFRLFVTDDGLDVARALYLDMKGQTLTAGAAGEGRRWIVEDCDLVSSVRYYFDGKLTLRPWLRSLRKIDECALWAADDPLPLAYMVAGDARATLARFAARLIGPQQFRSKWAKA